jgi:DNA polymerase-3 subunit alpha
MERDWGYDVYLCPPVNDATILRKLKETGLTHDEAVRAILTSEEIAQRVNVVIPQLPMVRYPLPPGYEDGVQLWREWIAEGWNYRGLDSKLKPSEVREYKERLEREMKVIEDKDFVDYFLIVSDAVRWAKDNGVAVGPARGSAAGSLAVWLLRITEVNPMKFPDLVFERFIDVTRKDLPDIDLDFDSLRRGEVEEYLVAKYGRECVNKVGTFTKFKSKNSLDDVARVFSVPKFRVEEIKDVLIERSSGDLRASATIEDTVDQFDIARKVVEEYPDLALATELEGNYKGFGVHSAGLVVSTGPITNVCAVYERKSKGEMVKVISLDKWDAEAKGLLKLDFLGLSTVTMLNFCREEMGWSLDDLYNLPLEDDRVIAGFKRNDVHGIFQIEGRACRYVNGALQPDDFHEVALVGALGRPGPLHNGAANEYIDIKMGRSQPDYIHDALIPITSHTNGQIVYQEQILRILGEVGGFDWTHRAEVRRIISKKLGDAQINARWTRFKDGAAELHGIDEDTAKRIWGMLITAGSYAFNASHAVAYGMLSWDTMWFKQHEPELFFQSALRITTDGDRTKRLIRDAHKGSRSPLPELAPYDRPKVEVLPPDPVKSGVTWERENGVLLAGFDQIPRVGESMAEQIITHRDENGFNSFDDLLSVKGVGPKTYAVMKEFYESDDPFGALWLDRAIEHVKQEIADENLMLPMPTHVASDLPYVRGEDMEVVWLGTVHTRNVRDLFEWNRARTGEELDRAEVRDPHLNEWCVMVGDDESDQIGLRVDRWRYPKWRNLIWKIRPGKDLILVRGYKPGFLATRQIWISHMWIVDPELDKGVNNGRAPAGPARGRAGSAGARAGRNGSALGRSGRGVGR